MRYFLFIDTIDSQAFTLYIKCMKKSNAIDRRDIELPNDDELYKLSLSTLKDLINKERRDNEIERLQEICSQKQTWNKTFIFCSLIITTLILNSFIWDYSQ